MDSRAAGPGNGRERTRSSTATNWTRQGSGSCVLKETRTGTIYNTYGVLTSGLLEKEEALELLLLGPEYTQVVLKTEKAAWQLKWLKAEVLTKEQLIVSAAEVAAEEQAYQELLSMKMAEMVK